MKDTKSGYTTPPMANRMPWGRTGTHTSSGLARPCTEAGKVSLVHVSCSWVAMSSVSRVADTLTAVSESLSLTV